MVGVWRGYYTEKSVWQRYGAGQVTDSPAWDSELMAASSGANVPFETLRLSAVTPGPVQISVDTLML